MEFFLFVWVCCLVVCVWFRSSLHANFMPHSSPIDWCEQNYAVTPWVAEFANTVSSVSFVIAGLAVPWFYTGRKWSTHEPNFYILWTLIVAVGIGSMLFHATLSVAGQILDELPICLLLTTATAMAVPLNQWSRSLRDLFFSSRCFATITPALTLLCLLFPVVSHVTCLLSLPLSTFWFLRLYFQMTPAKRPVRTTVGTTLLLVFSIVSWVADRMLCSELQAALGFNPQLHAFWHIGMACVVWGVVLIGFTIRTNGDGLTSQLCAGGPQGLVPYPRLAVDV